MKRSAVRVLTALVLAVLVRFVASTALAQTPGALPTAPDAAQKAGSGGYTAAKASLPGDHGSPLEPYLFLFILAGGGVVAGAFAVATDRAVRSSARPR